MSRRYRVLHGAVEHSVDLVAEGEATVDGTHYRVAPAGAGRYRVTDEHGHSTLVAVAANAHGVWTTSEGHTRLVTVDGSPKRAQAARAATADMTAPMPATVVKVVVALGARVEAGDPVVVLEAMKMEITVRAARAGIIRIVHCVAGELVTPGKPLVEIGE